MKKYAFWIAILVILIVVGSVLYSLATVSVPSPEARDNKRKYELEQVHKLLTMSYELNKEYPASLDEIQQARNLPYRYEVLAGGQDFKACATLEDKSEYCVTSKSQF